MSEGDDRQALQFLIDNGTITEESMKPPGLPWVLLEQLFKSEEHFWAFQGQTALPMLGNSHVRVYMCYPCASVI